MSRKGLAVDPGHHDNAVVFPSLSKENQAAASNSLPDPAILAPARHSSTIIANVRGFLDQEINVDLAPIPLFCYCFMTGYIDAIAFTASYVWCAFQTGNTIQLSLALARLFSGSDHHGGFALSDRQALVSLTSFIGGAALGRVSNPPSFCLPVKSRKWLVLSTLAQSGLTLAACLTAHYCGQSGFAGASREPSWTNTLGFLTLAFASASMGLQAFVGARIGSQFATTVVLTTIWVQFVGDPHLFELNRTYKPRDYKFLAIASLFVGGMIGRALVNSIGSSATLGLGAGLRVLIAFSWLLMPKASERSSGW